MSGTLHKDGIPERIGSGARDIYDFLKYTILGQCIVFFAFFYTLMFAALCTDTGLKVVAFLDMAMAGVIAMMVGV
ncbi:hypothetical protein FKW50_06815 [Acetobacter pomorum]|uniref:hypothetical protein n=1 Tax=Acetobacter TaxID=434 RepID=UPI0012392531|nr:MULTISPECIES: hypothetical protein [Acetobacter]KAA8387645.1 hypothetical protein FKW31_03090 [Acetobacter sp. DmW_136]KAA8419971.1 hypothetical protein FKW54_14465 [Acetobacter pomorum]KAA8435527.1 hypothetical protein FKW50_06815 [Acetobacter pomorum]KAA8448340.1 hypothetical protein FKW52_13640 [Acetobacter pomorum]